MTTELISKYEAIKQVTKAIEDITEAVERICDGEAHDVTTYLGELRTVTVLAAMLERSLWIEQLAAEAREENAKKEVQA
tara:strand:- start:120 stop:356 length:237 start_codon:yes stop_codon:yes gene_type:complete